MPKQKDQGQGKNWNTFLEPEAQLQFMTTEDLDEVVAIEKLSFRSPWPKSYFVQEIERNPISLAIVLRHHTKIAGFAVAWIIDRMFHVNNIAVHPKFRNRGYGRILMEAMIGLARKNQCTRVQLEVRVSNESAIQLYDSMGFRPLERLVRYYEDTHEDALVYVRQV